MVSISAVSASRFVLIWALLGLNLVISSFSPVSLCARVSRSTRHTTVGLPMELNFGRLVSKLLRAMRAVWAFTWLSALSVMVEAPAPVAGAVVLAVVSVPVVVVVVSVVRAVVSVPVVVVVPVAAVLGGHVTPG